MDPPPSPSFPTDTTRSADELAAHPEFVWYPAHRQLARSAPDWRLPFDRPTVEMRGYLGLLGTSLLQLREAMNRGNSARTQDSAYERLGLTVADVNIASRSGDAETLYIHASDRWGLSPTPTDPRVLGPSVDAPWRPESLGDWETIRVRALLDRLGLRLDELTFIIGTGYLRRFATLSMPALGAGCSLEGVVLAISWPSPLEAGQPGGTPDSLWKARLYAAALEGLFRFCQFAPPWGHPFCRVMGPGRGARRDRLESYLGPMGSSSRPQDFCRVMGPLRRGGQSPGRPEIEAAGRLHRRQ
jgi:hypothetical protein